MLTATALDLIARLLGGCIVEAGWGTSGSAPAPVDAGLTDPVYSELAPEVAYPGGGRLVVDFYLRGTSGTRTLQEIGLFGRDHQGNRVLLVRRVRAPVTMDESTVIHDTWTLFVEDILNA